VKLAVAIPSGGLIMAEFAQQLLNFSYALSDRKIPYFINMKIGSYLPHTRAKACGADLARGKFQKPFNTDEITHLLLVDTDIIFDPLDFDALAKHDLDIVSGMYCYSTSAYQEGDKRNIVAGYWDEEAFKKNYFFPPLNIGSAKEKSTNGLVEVDWVGLGFVLIKSSVFSKIEYPWFQSETVSVGEFQDSTSEDVGFCRKVKKAGIKIMLDTNIKVNHLKTYPV
jgi:GT2 family glycosyltransferase